MKRIKLFILLSILIFTANGKADTGYEFFRADDSLFYSAHLLYYSDGQTNNYFLVKTDSGDIYCSAPDDFIMLGKKGYCFPLVNIDYPFLIFKDNVSRFVHPNFAIKFLYLMNTIGRTQTVSDAMRKADDQLKYLKRGWTDVESSPHMYGLAADMVYYSSGDRSVILSKVGPLDIRFLEHGRGNLHIHLQDNEIWKHVKPEFDSAECRLLNDSLSNKVIPSEIHTPLTKAFLPPRVFKKYSFNNYTDGILKLVFLDKFGNTVGELKAGVFEPGSHEVFYNTDFLKPGAYTLRVYFNYDFINALPVFKG